MPEDADPKQINRDVLKLVWPSAVELFLVSLASTVDMMMVGSLGPWAIAAIGLTNQPKFIVMSLFMALNSGATAMVARFRGMEEQDTANAVMRQALMITGIFSIVMAIGGYFASGWAMGAMGAEADTLGPATVYLQIQMMGFPAQAITMSVTAVLRGVGNTRVPMVYNLVANGLNVLFNWLLIFGNLGFPQMGVAGASLATILGQVVAMIIAISALLFGKGNYLRIRRGDSFRPNFDLIKRIAKIGWPAMIEQFIMRAGMLLYVRVVASLGTLVYSTHQIIMNILNFTFMNGQAFGIAATAFIGINLGKGRPDLATIYVRSARRMGMMVSIFLALMFILFGEQIIGLFLMGSNETEKANIITTGMQILWIVAILQPLQCSQLILNGALRGAGDTRSTAMVMFIGVLLIRPVLSYALVNWLELGLIGAWLAMAADQVFRSIFSFVRFQMGKWKYIRV